MNVLPEIIENMLIDPFVFEYHLTGDRYLNFLEDNLGAFLDDVPLGDQIWSMVPVR